MIVTGKIEIVHNHKGFVSNNEFYILPYNLYKKELEGKVFKAKICNVRKVVENVIND